MAIDVTTSLDLAKATSGFLVNAVNNKINIAYPSATTETYTFVSGGVTQYVITVTYTDSTKENVSSAERTS